MHIHITLATLFGTTWILLVGPNFLVSNYLPINITLKIIYNFSDNSSNASPTALTHTGFILKVTDHSVFQSNCRTVLFQAPNYFCYPFLAKFIQSQ